jgi:hypothetical protein
MIISYLRFSVYDDILPSFFLCLGRRGSDESNLSLNSASDSPVPATEAENLMEMEEVSQCRRLSCRRHRHRTSWLLLGATNHRKMENVIV